MVSINLVLQPFPVPTDVTIQMPPGKREDGMKAAPTLKLSDLNEETLAALCDQFTNAVFAAAGKTL
jgi:hypothetical protein